MNTIGICNMALTMLGGNKILSLEDGTAASELCKQWFEPARDVVLESRDWTFASRRARLTPLAEPPVSEYEYQFQLPSDCLSVRYVSDEEASDHQIEYQKEEDHILARYSVIYIRYTAKITDSEVLKPGCYTAIAHRLAQYLSGPITGNAKLGDRLVVQSDNLVEESGAIDGRQGSPRMVTASKLIGARYRLGVDHAN